MRYLGELGHKLPVLTEEEWHSVFSFLEFFMTAESMLKPNDEDGIDFDWMKVTEVLRLLGKTI